MFIKEFIDQKFKFKYLTKVKSIYNSVIENVDTNISMGDTLKFAKLAVNFSDYQINTYQLPGIGGSYFIHNAAETSELIENVFLNHSISETDE